MFAKQVSGSFGASRSPARPAQGGERWDVHRGLRVVGTRVLRDDVGDPHGRQPLRRRLTATPEASPPPKSTANSPAMSMVFILSCQST